MGADVGRVRAGRVQLRARVRANSCAALGWSDGLRWSPSRRAARATSGKRTATIAALAVALDGRHARHNGEQHGTLRATERVPENSPTDAAGTA